MIWEIFGWGTEFLIFVTAVLGIIVLVQTGRHPTAWVNRVKAPPLPDYPFTVRGDDITGFY